MAEVYYRKWRPQNLAQITGQEHVTQTLLRALQTGRIAHAYLFCGPRGTGKTSTGRVLAKAVNCLNNEGKGDPCNSCDMCIALNQGSALDIIEIDAASNRGIDDIRDLREKVRFAPNSGRYKVYIIDEVHALTEHASNALLKTLEEPPAHAIFILATTEPHKLLPTILSRCQRFDFRRLSYQAVVTKLQHISEGEGISVDPEGLRLIARCVAGSLRDAENLLQQLVVLYGSEVQISQVEEMLGMVGDARIREVVQYLANKDLAGGLATIGSMVQDGLDLMHVTRSVVEYLRDMLLAKSGAQASLDLGPEDLAFVTGLVESMSLEDIIRALRLFGKIDLRGEYSSLPLELAFVESVSLQPAVKEAEGAARPARTKERKAPPPPTYASVVEDKVVPEAFVPAPAPDPVPEGDRLGYIKAHWEDFVGTLKAGYNLDAYMRSACVPEAIEDDTLVVAFFYPFHKEKIEEAKSRRVVEQKLVERFGSPTKLKCVLRPQEPEDIDDNAVVKLAKEKGGRVIHKRTDWQEDKA